jgi:hypothetical protein
MLRHLRTTRSPRRIVAFRRGPLSVASLVAAAAAVLSLGCSHPGGFGPRRAPVAVHVINENFLDMNVAAVISGVSRRLGEVTGNSTRDFTVDTPYGEPVTLTATPIGARGNYVSNALNVSMGQFIEMHIGSSLRQSSAVLRDSL